MLYAQLPIIRNTYTAIRNVDPALRSAAIGMGMPAPQRLARVEIPIALPVIIAGIRIAVVINIGVTAIAAYIGAGGLGHMALSVLKAMGGKPWDYDALNAWLKAPKEFVKGTKMAYAGVKKDQDRADLIAYLASLSDSPVPFPAP